MDDETQRALTRRQAMMGLAALLGTGVGLVAMRGVSASEAEPGDDHGSGGHGADDPPGDDHGGATGGNGTDDPPGDDNGGSGAGDHGQGRGRHRRRGRGRHS